MVVVGQLIDEISHSIYDMQMVMVPNERVLVLEESAVPLPKKNAVQNKSDSQIAVINKIFSLLYS